MTKPHGGDGTVLRPVHPKIKLLTPEETYVKALIYAEPGTGKTHLACTAPNPILLLTETAVSKTTIKNVERITGRRIPYWEINSLDDLEEAYEYLVGEGYKHYQTVILDGITDTYHRILAAAIEFAASNVNRKTVHDPDLPEQSDWQRVGNKLRTLVRLFRDLPMDVVVTALVMDVRSEMRTVPYIQPSKLALEIAAYFNLVGYLYADKVGENIVRKLQVEPDLRFVAKNPGGSLPPVVENPDFTKIFEIVKKGELANAKASA